MILKCSKLSNNFLTNRGCAGPEQMSSFKLLNIQWLITVTIVLRSRRRPKPNFWVEYGFGFYFYFGRPSLVLWRLRGNNNFNFLLLLLPGAQSRNLSRFSLVLFRSIFLQICRVFSLQNSVHRIFPTIRIKFCKKKDRISAGFDPISSNIKLPRCTHLSTAAHTWYQRIIIKTYPKIFKPNGFQLMMLKYVKIMCILTILNCPMPAVYIL